MARIIKIGLLFILGLALVLGGCSSPGSEVAGEQETPTEGESGTQEIIELKYADWHTTAMDLGQIHEEAAKMVEEKTNGRVKITPYWGGSLLEYGNVFSGVSSGVADIALYMHGMTPGVQPLTQLFKLPLGFENQIEATQGFKEMLQKFPEFQNENLEAGVRWLSLGPMPAYSVNMVKKEIRVPSDFKGLVINTTGIFADIAVAGGGGTANLASGEIYSSAEKNVINGQIVALLALPQFKTDEVFMSHTMLEPGFSVYGPMGFLVNMETWNSLPSDIQDVLVDVYQWACEERARWNTADVQKYTEQYNNDPKHTVIQITDEEAKLWEEAAQSYVEKWIEETEEKGLPARRIYEEVREMAKQMGES